MALRQGIKLSGANIQQNSALIVRRLRSISPALQGGNKNHPRFASGGPAAPLIAANDIKLLDSYGKKSKEYSSYSRSEKEPRRDHVNKYDAVEQYELEAAKPRDKNMKTNEVYEFLTKLRRSQTTRMLPHLQPSNLKPYGSTDNLIFPENLKSRDWIRYPNDQEDQSVTGSMERHYQYQTNPQQQEEEIIAKDEGSYDKQQQMMKAKAAQEEAEAYAQEEMSAESVECEKCSAVPWPSYSDSVKPRETAGDNQFNQTRKLSTITNQSRAPMLDVPFYPEMKDLPVGNMKMEDPSLVPAIGDPFRPVEIREPVVETNEVQAKKRGRRKKPPEVWDEYCPEEEIIEERCIVPQKEKKLPKLIPKDCPCIEPPEPCDVPPLPRLNLEVCEPRPECPQPCDEAVRADEDCWEYMQPAKVDCRTVPHKRTDQCKKKCKKGSKRYYSTFTGGRFGWLAATRQFSTSNNNNYNNKKQCCENDVPQKCVKPNLCYAPLRSDPCAKPQKCRKTTCEKFCSEGCAKTTDNKTCMHEHYVCCEKRNAPYPSYSECVVTYVTPFTGENNFLCESCGRNPRDEERCCRKYSTFSRLNTTLPVPLMPSNSDTTRPCLQ